MFRENNPAHFSPRNVAVWMTLSFQAGAINSGGFFACHRFVTHTTGFATFFGAEAANGHFVDALGMLSVPGFFLCGAMIAGLFIDQPLSLGLRPKWKRVLLIICGLMSLVTLAGIVGFFGQFGEPLLTWRDYILLATLCFASGLQNASVSRLTSGVIRTTHLTGITSDLGIGLVRQLVDPKNTFSRSLEARTNFLRVGIITSFVLGSFVASFVFLHAQFYGFILPMLTSIGLFAYSYRPQMD